MCLLGFNAVVIIGWTFTCCSVIFFPCGFPFLYHMWYFFVCHHYLGLSGLDSIKKQILNCRYKNSYLLILTMEYCLGGECGQVVGCWTQNSEVPGLNPPTCHWMYLSLASPNSTPPRFVDSQQVCLLPVGIFNKFLLIYDIFFHTHSVLN